jgi:osmotically-inducible protein OsmY
MSRRSPHSYDEIVARTVPEPDGSFRPTPEQLHDTREGRVLATDDELLAEQIDAALQRAGAAGITCEVEDARVTLRGAVRDLGTLDRIERMVRAIEGVEEVDNRLHLAT